MWETRYGWGQPKPKVREQKHRGREAEVFCALSFWRGCPPPPIPGDYICSYSNCFRVFCCFFLTKFSTNLSVQCLCLSVLSVLLGTEKRIWRSQWDQQLTYFLMNPNPVSLLVINATEMENRIWNMRPQIFSQQALDMKSSLCILPFPMFSFGSYGSILMLVDLYIFLLVS